MKNKITLMLAAAFVFFGAQSVKADGPANGNSSENVTLNIKLHPIQSLVVNPSQKEVNIEYKNKEDYSGGVTVSLDDHISFYSTGGFAINVKSEGANLKGTKDNIKLGDVKITATDGTTPLSGVSYTDVTLSQTETALVSSNTGGVDKNVKVEYSAAGDDKYINLYRNSENPTVFTTQVTYSIVAK